MKICIRPSTILNSRCCLCWNRSVLNRGYYMSRSWSRPTPLSCCDMICSYMSRSGDNWFFCSEVED